MRRIGRIVYREHARLIIWRRSVRIPCGYYHSVWDECDNDIGKDCDWCVLRSRVEIRSVVIRESFVGHIRLLIMGQSHYYWWHVAILLRLRVKYHCTTEKPARQPHACQPVSFELSFRIHITYRTLNIKIQPTLGHSSPISISNTHLPISSQLLFINHYSIN